MSMIDDVRLPGQDQQFEPVLKILHGNPVVSDEDAETKAFVARIAGGEIPNPWIRTNAPVRDEKSEAELCDAIAPIRKLFAQPQEGTTPNYRVADAMLTRQGAFHIPPAMPNDDDCSFETPLHKLLFGVPGTEIGKVTHDAWSTRFEPLTKRAADSDWDEEIPTITTTVTKSKPALRYEKRVEVDESGDETIWVEGFDASGNLVSANVQLVSDERLAQLEKSLE